MTSKQTGISPKETLQNLREISKEAIKKRIDQAAGEAVRAALLLQSEEGRAFMENVAFMIAKAYLSSKKVLICGNGGSLCDAMHFAEELTGQFRHPRKALPALALADAGHISCVGNDMGFDQVFSRAVEAHGVEGDILVVLTTSGNSSNIVHALNKAKEKKMATVAFLGKEGGKVAGMADLEWIVSGFPYSDRIQEVHMAAIHIIIEMVEALLFESPCP